MRVVTVRKNLWPFGSSAPKSKTKRSSATIGAAMKAAFAAGKKSGDTGLFHSWLSESGLADRSDTLIARLQKEYDRGFESTMAGSFQERAAKDVKGFTYKRQKVVPVEGGWKIVGRFDDGTIFDEPEDARRFLDSWNRTNPNPSTLTSEQKQEIYTAVANYKRRGFHDWKRAFDDWGYHQKLAILDQYAHNVPVMSKFNSRMKSSEPIWRKEWLFL